MECEVQRDVYKCEERTREREREKGRERKREGGI